jgi:hypothetical protein
MNVQSNNGKITAPTFSANAELSNDARKSFVLRGEHKRKWTAENPNNHIGICLKIDGGLIANSNQSKCDGGLLLNDNRLYLIEFKGKAYDTAATQLIETKEHFKKNYGKYDLIFHARIVGKSFPKAPTSLQKAKRILKGEFDENFKLFEKDGKETV